MFTHSDVQFPLVERETFDFFDEIMDLWKGDGVFVELGSWTGNSIIYMAQRAKALKKPIKFYAIDHWLADNVGDNCKVGLTNFFQAFLDNVAKAQVDDVITSIKLNSTDAVHLFEDNSVFFLFVDDGHCYPHTLNVLEAWYPKVMTGGYIVGHDWSSADGVKQAVKEKLGNNIRLTPSTSSYLYEKRNKTV